MPLENRRETLMAAATLADRLGYDAFFQNETWALDATILLAEAAVTTRRIGLGTGILGVWNRTAATLAMAAATLHAMSGGRFTLGLGSSTPQLAEGLHDVPYVAPIERMRRVVTQVRALLRGERVPLHVATAGRALKLNVPAAPDLPIGLAALNGESVRLAGELADAWLPFLYPWARLGDGMERLREGAARGGHPDRLPRIVPSVPAVVAESAARAREGAAWFVSFYLTTMGPLYRTSLARQGFQREVDAVLRAAAGGQKGVVPSGADPLLEQLVVWGTPAEARQRLARWQGAGADLTVLLLRPGLGPEELAFTLQALRPEDDAPGSGPR